MCRRADVPDTPEQEITELQNNDKLKAPLSSAVFYINRVYVLRLFPFLRTDALTLGQPSHQQADANIKPSCERQQRRQHHQAADGAPERSS